MGADLADAHLDACRAARPDPEELARRLIGHALGDVDDGSPTSIRSTTRNVLGDEGMAVLRMLVVQAWRGNRRG